MSSNIERPLKYHRAVSMPNFYPFFPYFLKVWSPGFNVAATAWGVEAAACCSFGNQSDSWLTWELSPLRFAFEALSLEPPLAAASGLVSSTEKGHDSLFSSQTQSLFNGGCELPLFQPSPIIALLKDLHLQFSYPLSATL